MKKITRYQRLVLCVCLSSVVTFANIYWLQPLLPTLKESFRISTIEANLAMSFPLMGMGIGLVIFAAISDSVGRCTVLLTGTALGLSLSALLLTTNNYSLFLLLRFLQGAAFAACPAIAVPLMAEELRKSWLPAAVGYYIASNTLGGLFSRIIAGTGTGFFGSWKVGGVLIVGISTLFFIAIFLLMPQQRHFSPCAFKLRTSLGSYVKHLSKLRLVLIYMTICIGFGVFVNLTNYLMMVLKSAPYNMPDDIRSIMFLTLLGGTTSSTLAGRFARKHSQLSGTGLGIVIMLVSVVLMSGQALIYLVAGMILLSVGFFFCHANASALVSNSVRKARGSAQALYSLFYYSGAGLGVLYFEPFFSYSGWSGVTEASAAALIAALMLVVVCQFIHLKDKQLPAKTI